MDNNLRYIISLINFETNPDGIFFNKEIFSHVISLIDKTNQQRKKIIIQSESLDGIDYSLLDIEDVIDLNKKYYNYE